MSIPERRPGPATPSLLTAATALAQGHELATLNRAEFARVAGLRLLPLDRFVA